MFAPGKSSATVDVSYSWSRTALAQMSEHGIPPSPAHYCVWYHYASGSPPGLKNDLDQLLAGFDSVTAVNSLELFKKHFGTEIEAKALERIGADLIKSMAGLGQQLDEAGENTSTFTDQLQAADGTLQSLGVGSNSSVREIVMGLIRATSDMAARNQSLEESLQSTSAQVVALQDHLAQVRAEAMTDPLTGIANRRYFDMRLHEHSLRAQAEGASLSLMMVDIDHFKRFNESYGQRVGDQVLKAVGTALKSAAIGEELPARYGGEEFAVLMPGLSAEMALLRAERLRLNLANQYLRHKPTGESFGRITVSIGIAHFRPGETGDHLVSRADSALERAKRQGRNQVVIDSIAA